MTRKFENADKVDVDDAGDETPPYGDQFEDGDAISGGEGASDGVEINREVTRKLIFECTNIYYFRGNI